MHADLVKLLDLQAKDSAVAEVERRLGGLREETSQLDQALERAREVLEAARRTARGGGTSWSRRSKATACSRSDASNGWSTCGIRRRPPP